MHGHGIPDQLEDKMGEKLGWETSQEGGHCIPDQVGDNMGNKLGEKTGDKLGDKPRRSIW